MNILDAIKDPNLFGPFLSHRLESWSGWLVALRCLYGLQVCARPSTALVKQCTGRYASSLPRDEGFGTALFLTGRRSGKSRVAALIAAWEAVLAGHHEKLAPGEKGVVAVLAPTKAQGRIVKDYVRAILDTPMLRAQVVGETATSFELRTGVKVEIMAGDWKTVRGYTLLAAIVDEVCFFGYEAEAKVRSDTELVRAIRPSLATVGGRLVAISSPYAKRGWAYLQWKRNFGNEKGRVLVWHCGSRVMNPTLPQRVIDDAYAEDPVAARSEYGGQWRDDVMQYLTRDVVEQYVVEYRTELLPELGRKYRAFADLSGGRMDDAALAIAHKDGRKVVLDFVRRWRPPHSPYDVIKEMATELRRYRCRRVTGDNYAAEFVAQAFKGRGVGYTKSPMPKSELYGELLPRLCSGDVELLDDHVLVDQLAALERRTRAGGRDVVDHPPGGRDDVANAVAGVVVTVTGKRRIATALPGTAWGSAPPADREQLQGHEEELAAMCSAVKQGA